MPDQRPYIVKNTCIYKHIFDFGNIVFELTFFFQIILRVKHFYENRDGWEMLITHLLLRRRPARD